MNITNQIRENETALKFFAAYNDRNLDTMLALFTKEAQVVFIPFGKAGMGKVNQLGKTIWSQLLVSFPNIYNVLNKSRVDDEGKLICEVNIKGKQSGDFFEIKNVEAEFDSDHIFIFRFDDHGWVDYISINWDHHDFCRQLGQ